MAKKMLINIDADENRVAIVEDGRLENLEIETNLNEQVKGNIYKGVVHKVEQSLQAAFVDYGAEKQGFLPLGEIHPRYWPKDAGNKPAIQDILKNRQELIVQVTRDEIGNKGATLTTYVSLPGRYLVLIPESEKTGISRKLSDEERARLKELLADMTLPEGFGAIIRTAGTDRSLPELQLDLSYLTKVWDAIETRFREQKGAGLVFEERSLAVRFMRDYFSDDVEEVWIDDSEGHKEVLEFVNVIMPQHAGRVKLYQGRVPLFIKQGVEDQIEDVFARKVQLPSGGSIVLDSTEALVAIDVNSGRVKGEDIEETAFTTNMEAAREIARQVIIRDLGGLVIVDFIDMKDRKRMRQVEQALREAFRNDKARRKFSRISEFGLLEMTRQRLKSTLTRTSFERCDHCGGQGLVRSAESAGMYLLRRIREIAARGGVHQVIVRAPIPVANFMLNRKRPELHALEADQKTLVEVWGDTDLPPNQAVLESVHRRGKGAPQRVTQTVDLVRAEIVRRDEESLKRGILTRDPGRSIDFQNLYKEVIEEVGPVEAPTPAPAPAPRPAPVAQPAPVAPPAPAAPPFAPSPASDPPKERRFSWWRKLFGAAEEPEPTPHAPPAGTPAPVATPHQPAHTPLQAPLHVGGGQRHGGGGGQRSGQTHVAKAPKPTPAAPPAGRPELAAAAAAAVDDERSPKRRKRRRRRSRGEGRPEGTAAGATSLDELDDGTDEGDEELEGDEGGAEAADGADAGEGGEGGEGRRRSRRRRGRGRGRGRGERGGAEGEGDADEGGADDSAAAGDSDAGERPQRHERGGGRRHGGEAAAKRDGEPRAAGEGGRRESEAPREAAPKAAEPAPKAAEPAPKAAEPAPRAAEPAPREAAPKAQEAAQGKPAGPPPIPPAARPEPAADSRWVVDLRTPARPPERGEE